MRMNHFVSGVLGGAAALAIRDLAPIYLVCLLLAVPFIIGTAQVFTVRGIVVGYFECGERAANLLTLAIVESLTGPGEETTLLSFVTAGKRRFCLDELNQLEDFVRAKRVIKLLGWLPCAPACAWLARKSEVR